MSGYESRGEYEPGTANRLPAVDTIVAALPALIAALRERGTCGYPGPYNAHCTDYPGHRYSCYDAGEDVSFNDRQDWLGPHDCGDPDCPDRGYQAEVARGLR